MEKTRKQLIVLAVFVFVISPICAWTSVIASDETAVYASLSRMIWYSGDALRILIAMLVMFLPMLVAFFLSHKLIGLSQAEKWTCRVCMIVSCTILYMGAMEIEPSNGITMSRTNIWHGVLSFGGILMIYLTYCLYTFLIRKKNKVAAGLLSGFLAFTLITGSFAVLNVFDDKSYVIASAVAELYVLTMFSLIGYLTLYLSYLQSK